MLTIKYLRKVSAILENVGFSADDAKKIISVFAAVGDASGVDRLEKLDYETIKAAAREKGVKLPAGIETKIKTRKDHDKQKAAADRKADNNNIDNAAGGADAGNVVNDPAGLPLDFCENIKTMLTEWAQSNDIESMQKASQTQWRAACMFVGMWSKQNNVYVDIEKSRTQGGKVYNAGKIADALTVWAYLCGVYKKTPLVSDFIDFCGVSSSWFYNNNGHCELSSAGADIYKKASEIQKKGFVSGIVESRENPTGKIFLGKVFYGWNENGINQAMQETNTQKADSLPVFDVLQIAEKPETPIK